MRHYQAAFSLIELLMVLALISSLLTFAVPSFQSMIAQVNDNMMTSRLLHAIHIAQTEAIIRQKVVTLHKLPNGWAQGYSITADGKNLHIFYNKYKGNIHWRAFPLHRENLQFLRTGMTRHENGTFWYCRKNDKKPRWAMVINQAGRTKVIYPNEHGDIEKPSSLIC